MILFLDKDPQRAALAYNRMSEADRGNTVWCRTVEEAVSTLRDYPLTRVHLEHDLGDEQYANTKRDDCGMEVVRFLEKWHREEPETFVKFKDTRFIVHTWNDHAGPIMLERLLKIGLSTELKPFGM